ncbi:unnamed protein product [Gongylonema pulchrum]|uniref:G_PROTEIN_RECEP_F1_2 domain-containing protein n=1 Tax=Gongylonema pulchrum TaxID=637853 RepID=A0A183E4R4_9BILA|nr:unnamed protein product [Gongylonema pulchrum]
MHRQTSSPKWLYSAQLGESYPRFAARIIGRVSAVVAFLIVSLILTMRMITCAADSISDNKVVAMTVVMMMMRDVASTTPLNPPFLILLVEITGEDLLFCAQHICNRSGMHIIRVLRRRGDAPRNN